MSLSSEDPERRQRVLQTRRHATVRQVQVAETLHESVRRVADMFRRRLQSVATQVLPAFQLHRVCQFQVSSAVRSLQQSALL